MNRRHVLKSAASTAVGAGVLAGGATETMSAPRAPSNERPRGRDFVEATDGTRLAFTDWGEGKPVVFIHAWALPSPMWDYQRGPLARRGLRCIAYDRRGHGHSSVPSSGYDCDSLADDLATLLNELDLNEVTLVGYSFGGGEIVRYLTRHGTSRIAKIVLIAPAATPFVMKTADNPNGVPAENLELFRATIEQDFPKWLHDDQETLLRCRHLARPAGLGDATDADDAALGCDRMQSDHDVDGFSCRIAAHLGADACRPR